MRRSRPSSFFAAKQPEAVHILYLSGTADEKNGTHFVWFHLDQEPTGPDSDNDSLRDAHAISIDDIRDLFAAAHVPLILIADDCLGSISGLRSNELVAFAGRAAFENSDGGFFKQALLKQLRDEQKEQKISKLSSAFFSAALTVFDKSGKQQAPVVIWHASSPDIDVKAGKLVPTCQNP